jgi:hypothetical protein
MRFQAGVAAAVLLARPRPSVSVRLRLGSRDGPNCDDFPTQIDIPNSILGDLDPTDLDAEDDGVGCEDNAGPPTAYDLTAFPPAPIQPEPEPDPQPQPEPKPAPTPEPQASPATPVQEDPDFTG